MRVSTFHIVAPTETMGQTVLASGTSTLRDAGAFPMVRTVAFAGESPWDVYQRVVAPHRPSCLLESGKGPPGVARYSFIAGDPYLVFTGGEGRYTLTTAHGATHHHGEPLPALLRLLDTSMDGRQSATGERAAPSVFGGRPFGDGAWPPFIGGAVGYVSYDAVRRYETLPSLAINDLCLPDVEFLFFDVLVAIDHHAHLLHMMFTPAPDRLRSESHDALHREGVARLDALEHAVRAPTTTPSPDADARERAAAPVDPRTIRGAHAEREYVERVQRCQAFIRAGDIYQVNLAQRFSADMSPAADPSLQAAGRNLYHRLRRVNPSPFSGLFITDNVALVSSSPERLVRVAGDTATMRPIAGTRPRGRTAAADRALTDRLRHNEKERAEHLMLVDLARNDLGRVCRYGSVRVEEFMTIEQYSHVAHMVSEVRGALHPSRTTLDILRAVFPGGTITGAPKIRCMEIIEALEPVRRGPYTGSLGYISWTGAMDFNILIRTLVLTNRRAYLHAGAGIVADSHPRREYQETLYKAQALFDALR